MKKLLLSLLCFFVFAVHAEQKITIIVPNTPGGIVDGMGRAMAKAINESEPNVDAVVINKPGADGQIAIKYFLEYSSKQDMILVAPTGPILINKVFYKKLDYDFNDFEFVMPLGVTPLILAASSNSGIKSVKDLIKYSENKMLNCASGSSANTFIGKIFFRELNIKNAQFIPFKGTGDLLTTFVTGDLDCIFDPAIPRSNKAIFLAVSSSTRHKEFADVPLFADSVPNFEFHNIFGFAVARNISDEQRIRLMALLKRVSKSNAWKESIPSAVIPATPVTNPHKWLEQKYNFYEKSRKALGIEQLD